MLINQEQKEISSVTKQAVLRPMPILDTILCSTGRQDKHVVLFLSTISKGKNQLPPHTAFQNSFLKKDSISYSRLKQFIVQSASATGTRMES